MSNHKYSFRSQAERERDEALCCRYRRIGIPAVAAAKTVESQYGQPKTASSQQMGWMADPDLSPES
jgi:hypothetical protein